MNSESNLDIDHAPNPRSSPGFLTKIFLFLLDFIYILWFLVCSALISVLSFPFIFCHQCGWKKGKMQTTIRRFIQFYGRWVIRFSWPMIRIKVEIPEEVKKADPCVYVLNHFSFADVYFCGFLPGFQTVIAVRSWPFKLPIYNIFMRLAGYMDVETTSPEDILEAASHILESGSCILFFPEGHRSKNGQLLPLQKGAFRIAAENRVPLVPVAIEGTECFGGYKSKFLWPCRVRLRFFPPLLAQDTSLASVNDLRNRVKALFLLEVYGK